MKKYFLLAVIFFIIPQYAFSYLDPSTGSLLISILISIGSAAFFFIRYLYYKLPQNILKRFISKDNKYHIVFYSEGNNYWSTFKPILCALDEHEYKLNIVYYTSDKQDEGLTYAFKNIKTEYIGNGNKAYAKLNVLDAYVCAMTTPGLDVLQIKRSKYVKHYTHVFHSIVDIHFYKLYSFDYYDSMLCVNKYQMKSIRFLEKLRNTKEKLLFESGCPYIDDLAKRANNYLANVHKSNTIPCILISPIWGKNSLFTIFGSSFIATLAKKGYKIIIRPHPQSFISEKKLIEKIQNELSKYSNIEWDKRSDNFYALSISDIMISDSSGIIFDYALLFEKNIITVKSEFNTNGTEGIDIEWGAFERDIVSMISKQVDAKEICKLVSIIDSLIYKKSSYIKNIDNIRKKIFNYKQAGNCIANQLIEIYKNIKYNS